jgi:hypothetical protein
MHDGLALFTGILYTGPLFGLGPVSIKELDINLVKMLFNQKLLIRIGTYLIVAQHIFM